MTGFTNCKEGCGRCCEETGIEITLFDLFRNWGYQNLGQGKRRKFSQVVNQLWNTKHLVGVPIVEDGRQVGQAIQLLVQPCPLLTTDKRCSTYAHTRFYICEAFPDSFFEQTDVIPMKANETSFLESLPCMPGYRPSPERQAFVQEVLKASVTEAKFGWDILNSLQPIQGGREKLEREVLRRLQVFDDRKYMRQLHTNIKANPHLMRDYCRLMNIDPATSRLYQSDAWESCTF